MTNDIKSAEDWFDNLELFVDKKNIALLLEPKQSRYFDDNDLSKGWLLEGLAMIQKNENPIIITTPDIFNVSIPNTNDVKKSWITLKVNEKIVEAIGEDLKKMKASKVKSCIIGHANNILAAQHLKKVLKENIKCEEILEVEIGCTATVHMGPKSWGIGYYIE